MFKKHDGYLLRTVFQGNLFLRGEAKETKLPNQHINLALLDGVSVSYQFETID